MSTLVYSEPWESSNQ